LFDLEFNLLLTYITLILGIIIIFRPKDLLYLLKLILITHIVTFVVGGMATTLFYYTNSISLGFNFIKFSPIILLLVISFMMFLVRSLGFYVKNSVISKQTFYNIRIYFKNKHTVFNALLDTGNSLHDEITGASIIITELDSIKNIFPKEILKSIQESNFEKLCASKIKFRFVSFKSIGKEEGVLICFRPDKVNISNLDNSKNKKNNHVYNINGHDVLVGVINFSLSDSYSGLIGPDLIN
jgi:stage II sporulation protein GA (sporulation sigma-E factor processing peptidase)